MIYYPNGISGQVAYSYLPPQAAAILKGSTTAPYINGVVTFKEVPGGVEVHVDVSGLPLYRPAESGKQPIGPFGFHIHEIGNCEESSITNSFEGAGGHWNPGNQPHGNHAGDFPVLFSNHGYSRMSFFTDKFQIKDILGKAVVIHENPDDYRTQPAGNSGKRIACGVIKDNSAYRPYYPY